MASRRRSTRWLISIVAAARAGRAAAGAWWPAGRVDPPPVRTTAGRTPVARNGAGAALAAGRPAGGRDAVPPGTQARGRVRARARRDSPRPRRRPGAPPAPLRRALGPAGGQPHARADELKAEWPRPASSPSCWSGCPACAWAPRDHHPRPAGPAPGDRRARWRRSPWPRAPSRSPALPHGRRDGQAGGDGAEFESRYAPERPPPLKQAGADHPAAPGDPLPGAGARHLAGDPFERTAGGIFYLHRPGGRLAADQLRVGPRGRGSGGDHRRGDRAAGHATGPTPSCGAGPAAPASAPWPSPASGCRSLPAGRHRCACCSAAGHPGQRRRRALRRAQPALPAGGHASAPRTPPRDALPPTPGWKASRLPLKR